MSAGSAPPERPADPLRHARGRRTGRGGQRGRIATARHAAWFGLLIVAILAAHLLVVDRLRAWLDADAGASAAAPRLQAAFVRELLPAPAPVEPATARPPAPPPRARANARSAAAPAQEAASEPLPAASAAAAQQAEPDASQAPQAQADGTPSDSAEAAAAPGPAAPAFEWPADTRLRYALTGYVRGEVSGSAQVEWLRDGSHYQVHLDVTVGASFAPLMQRRMTSDGQITAAGLAPRRYDERTQVAFAAPREASVSVQWSELDRPLAVTLADGRQLPALPGVQDAASQFVQLTWMLTTQPQRLQPGARFELPVALPRRLDVWVYDVLGEETLDTPVGRVPTWHLRPQREGDATTLTAEAWFAPGLQYLPVRIVIRSGKDDFIDLLIDRLPMQSQAPSEAVSPAR